MDCWQFIKSGASSAFRHNNKTYFSLQQCLRGKGREINRRKFVMILAFLTAGAILSIYIYDMLGCIFYETPIPLIEIVTFAAILIGTIGAAVFFKKKHS